MDEEWFTTVHINIEAAAGRGLAVLLPAQAAVEQDDATALAGYLNETTPPCKPCATRGRA